MSKFEQLPNEILFKIFDYNSLSAKDLISLSNVCQRFDRFCCSEEKLWESKFEQKWPLAWKKINFGSTKSSLIETWKKGVEDSVKISEKLEELLNSLSHHLHTFFIVTSPVLIPIFQLLDVGNLAPLIVFNELLLIINSKSAADLTIRFYAKEILPHVHCYFWSKKFRKFLALPPESQSLEKAAFYFGKCFCPEDFFGVDYEEVSSILDQLAYKVQLHLRTKNPTHPAATIKLLSPDEPLKNSLWSDEMCSEIHECINHIAFKKHPHRRYCDIKEEFSNNILGPVLGYDGYVLLIFKATCHRLGILLNLIIFNDHGDFLLEWKSNLEILEVTDPFFETRRHWNYLTEKEKIQIRQKKSTIRRLLLNLASGRLIAWREEEIGAEFFGAAAMILEIHSLPEDYCELVKGDVFEFCLHYGFHLEVVLEICEKLLKMSSDVEDEKKIRNVSSNAKKLLTIQQEGHKPIIPKKRIKGVDMKFAIGMMVYLEWRHSPGVIFGWDEKYNLSIEKQGEFHLPLYNTWDKEKPYYLILFSDGTVCYECQEFLFTKPEESLPVTNDKVGKYFKAFNGKFYVPNEELRSEYPDDENFIQELLSYFT